MSNSCSLKKSNKIHVRVGDMVCVICGKDKKKRGRVIAVSRSEGKAIVSGVMIISKHVKARKAGDESGIIKTESAIRTCKLQVVCPKCDKSTRIAHSIDENGIKKRICKKCGQELVFNK